MSVATTYKCEACGLQRGVEKSYLMPNGWISISIEIHGEPESSDLKAHACSRPCAATLIRDYSADWRPT